MMARDEEIAILLRKYALLNALAHDGKADKGAVVGRLMAERSDLRGESKRVSGIASSVVSEINGLDRSQQVSALQQEFPESLRSEIQRKKEQSKKDSEKGAELPELEDARIGEVVTRFPPEPNGFMHIGHTKAAILGSEYAKMYSGRFLMRFDDTNPSAEKREYYGAFIDDFAWLGITPDAIRNSSDDMDRFYEFAEKMIAAGKAYVCSCSQEMMRELRGKGEECKHRSQSVSENLNLWRKMISREVGKSDATFRFHGDMKSLNTTMRDPVLFRIIDDPHPLLGNKYSVWPTYDFAGPVEDSLDGVTHAMRSKEYELRDQLYFEILKALELTEPKMIEFSRLKLQNTTLSKRNLKKFVEEKLVEGWDDPRLPTISALRRRGFLALAIRQFILSMGVSKVESEPTWDLLESFNRKLLDPIAKRYFFVPNPVKLKIANAPKVKVTLKYHPDENFGERSIDVGDSFFIPGDDADDLRIGSNARLIEAYNIQIAEKNSSVVKAKYIGEERVAEMPKLQWVCEEAAFPMKAKIPGPLLINNQFNPDSLRLVDGVAESAARQIQIGEIVQFVRFGFCRMDTPGIVIRTHS
jgi:glutamyl-tRNA synthetase